MSLAAALEHLDPETVQRACAGDRRAVEELVRVMQRPFYNLALRMLSDRTIAEDAVQECLLRVVTHLSQYRQEAKFATWATRIAVNSIFDFRSGVARRARYQFDEFAAGLATGRDETATERPEDALILKEANTLCNRALLQCIAGDHPMPFVLWKNLDYRADVGP